MDKEQLAIARLQEASKMSLQVYKQPLVVTTSGGKDSSVCVALADRAGIPFEVQHNHTTADAPETVYFVRTEFKRLEAAGIQCTVNYPIYKGKRTSMWQLIPQKMIPPTRTVRYCCSILKERGGIGRFIVTGVRWAESISRKNGRGIYEVNHKDKEKRIILNNDNDDRRRLFESCTKRFKEAFMANKNVPAQNGESPVEAQTAASGAKNAPVAAEYSVEELAAGAKTVFPGISPDCVTAALRLAGITKTTKEKAKEIVDKFVNEPVAGPKKGGN